MTLRSRVRDKEEWYEGSVSINVIYSRQLSTVCLFGIISLRLTRKRIENPLNILSGHNSCLILHWSFSKLWNALFVFSIYSTFHFTLICTNFERLKMSWSHRPNPEDRINRKPEDQKIDHRTENTKYQKTEKINSTMLNLKFGPISS